MAMAMAARSIASRVVRAPLSPAAAARPSQQMSRRTMSSGGHDEEPRVNIWEAPFSPSKWKEEHTVLASLSLWGLIFYGGYKAATG